MGDLGSQRVYQDRIVEEWRNMKGKEMDGVNEECMQCKETVTGYENDVYGVMRLEKGRKNSSEQWN